MKIYTKTGDNGTTGLFGGARLNKDDIRIESYGTVDELNSNLGLLRSRIKIDTAETILSKVQNTLFVIGSHLATKDPAAFKLPDVEEALITELELSIDAMNEELDPLKTFILPGGNENISICHVCRTICRRAERRCVTLSLSDEIHPLIIPYLNRLSDYFFVLSRYIALKEDVKEIPWIP